LRIETRRRSIAAFAPVKTDDQPHALLISNDDPRLTEQSFYQLTGSDSEYRGWHRFNHLSEILAQKLWPTLLQPLQSRTQMQAQLTSPDEREAWDAFIEQPLGLAIEQHMQDDLVRGLTFTNAKIGILNHPHDRSLRQNRTYLMHAIGQGTGDWRVVVGGMGHVSRELTRVAQAAGAELLTASPVIRIEPGSARHAVTFIHADREHTVDAAMVLSNVAPTVLAKLLPESLLPTPEVEGAAFKINMLFQRLPRLKAHGYTAHQAFSGTFHMDERYTAMQGSYEMASHGFMPDTPPGEMYCQTMTDDSILSPELRAAGYHTVTLFGLDMPARLFRDNPEKSRQQALRRYIKGINQYLAEPLEDCLAVDADGQPCIEAKSAVDLEKDLGLPAGHIFHQDLSWPFTDDPAQVGRWGVETRLSNMFLCGSGALRGGCVSGIPGHHAAMHVLESLRKRQRA
jgi:phytoene dehydrogenase-like protein